MAGHKWGNRRCARTDGVVINEGNTNGVEKGSKEFQFSSSYRPRESKTMYCSEPGDTEAGNSKTLKLESQQQGKNWSYQGFMTVAVEIYQGLAFD